MELAALENNFVQYQCLDRKARHTLSNEPRLAAYWPRCSHGDRVINRHSGERAAYGSRVWLSRRAETLSHVPPGLRTLYLKRYMRQPGQKAVTGRVASHIFLFPYGRTMRPVRPLELNGQTGNGA
jgi:hypothetical protein